MTMAEKIEERLKGLGDAATAAQSMRFFKTGPGEYGEGDRFLGIRVPVLRKLAKELIDTPLDDAVELLQSPFHEARLAALLIWVYQAKRGDSTLPLYRAYLANTDRINNWDLVDVTAEHIVGRHLFERSRNLLEYAPNEMSSIPVLVGHASRTRERVSAQNHRLPGIPGKPVLQEAAAASESLTALTKLAKSENLWERRIAILSTFHFIRRNDFDDTLAIADLLLNDSEDLMHKAVGWMLREVGNRDLATEEIFLLPRYKQMPRTMLRYAIERFPEPRRKSYLLGQK